MTTTTNASPNADPFQASRALFDALRDFMGSEESMKLSHYEIEVLLMEKNDKLIRQMWQDFLVVSDECESDQTAEEVHVDECQKDEPASDSNSELFYSDSSLPEVGPDDDVPTADCQSQAMRSDAPCLATAQVAHQFTVPSIGLFGCGNQIAATDAVYDDIRIPHGSKNVLILNVANRNLAGQLKLRPVDHKRHIVIDGVTAAVSQTFNELRTPARLLALLYRPRPIYRRVSIPNDIIPRAA